MATSLATNITTQETPPAQPYGSMNQVSSGPAGQLYSLADQLIKIYNQLQSIYNQMNNSQTMVQLNTITAGADAQRSAALYQALSTASQAAGSIASGVIALKISQGMNAESAEDVKNLDPAQKELTRLKDMNNLKPATEHIGLGENEGTELSEVAKGMTQGQYPEGNATDMQKEVDTMKPPELAQFKEKLKADIATKETEVNTYNQHLTKIQTEGRFKQDQWVSGANTFSQGLQSGFNGAAGWGQAGQQVSGSVSQMAGSTAGSAKQGLDQAYAKVEGALNAAKQGSQAYAQT